MDEKIPAWLSGIAVDPDLIPAIQEVYIHQVKQLTENNLDSKLFELKRRYASLKEEETRLGRLLITEKITEETYDKLRAEWQEKLRQVEINMADLQRATRLYKDDLDVALALMGNIAILYPRLSEDKQSLLLRILAKQIIVNPSGEIIDYELNSPFIYLHSLADYFRNTNTTQRGSEQVSLGALSF